MRSRASESPRIKMVVHEALSKRRRGINYEVTRNLCKESVFLFGQRKSGKNKIVTTVSMTDPAFDFSALQCWSRRSLKTVKYIEKNG